MAVNVHRDGIQERLRVQLDVILRGQLSEDRPREEQNRARQPLNMRTRLHDTFAVLCHIRPRRAEYVVVVLGTETTSVLAPFHGIQNKEV